MAEFTGIALQTVAQPCCDRLERQSYICFR